MIPFGAAVIVPEGGEFQITVGVTKCNPRLADVVKNNVPEGGE
jgi:hypothetical protein